MAINPLQDPRGISEGDRRSGGGVRLGVVEEIDYARSRVRLRMDPGGAGEEDESSLGLVSDWLPWGTWAAGRLRVWSPPVKGQQATLLSPSGEPHTGVVMPAIFEQSGQFPAPSDRPDETLLKWEDGGYLRYDLRTHKMILHAPCGVWIDGPLIASGDVMAQGGNISLVEHIHCGVERGGSCTDEAEGGGGVPCGGPGVDK